VLDGGVEGWGALCEKYRIQIVDTDEEQDEGEPDNEDTDDGELDSEELRDDEYGGNEFQQPDTQHKVSCEEDQLGKTNTVGWLRSSPNEAGSEASVVTSETSTLDIEGRLRTWCNLSIEAVDRYFWLTQ
jgi:hypothetical protein